MVSANDGLVLRDVKLGQRYMAEKISVPYYYLETSAFAQARGELKPAGADDSINSTLVNYSTTVDDEKLVVEATYSVHKIPLSSASCLQITQRYEFYREGALPCEPSQTLPCSNFKPSVKYKFFGQNGETLKSINIVQREHFTVKNYLKNSVGLFRDCDGTLNCIFGSAGLVFKEKQNPLFTELTARVIDRGKGVGSWDNIHQTYQGAIDEPLDLSRLALAGCPECVHTHWRWGENLFTNSEKFNNFLVFVPPGSKQAMDFAIVRYNASEDDSQNEPQTYKQLVNAEPIRHPATSFDLREQMYDYTAPDEVVVWYSATNSEQPQDTFLIHPRFFNASEKDIDAPIANGNSLAAVSKRTSSSHVAKGVKR